MFVQGGNNIGRVGVLQHIEHHPGSYEIAHVKDSRGETFATRLGNIFVIGEGSKPLISLSKEKGLKLSLVEQRDARDARRAVEVDEE